MENINEKGKKISSIFIVIILVLIIFVLGFVSYRILTVKNVETSIDIAEFTSKINVEIQSQDEVIALLYEEKATPPTVINNVSTAFINKRAMVIGDSTAEGLVAYQQLDSTSVVYTRGRCIQYMYADMDRVLQYVPDVLFLAYGANDLLSWNGNVDGYINAYTNVIEYLKQNLPNTKICINSVLPVSDEALASKPAFGYEPQFNERLKALCDSYGVTYIDNRSLLQYSTGERTYESDGVHPKPFYYSYWASNMASYL